MLADKTIYRNQSFAHGIDGDEKTFEGDGAEQNRRVAYFVDQILKGTPPAELPVERPMKFDFAINLQTAKKLGITIPQSVLFRADWVIK